MNAEDSLWSKVIRAKCFGVLTGVEGSNTLKPLIAWVFGKNQLWLVDLNEFIEMIVGSGHSVSSRHDDWS